MQHTPILMLKRIIRQRCHPLFLSFFVFLAAFVFSPLLGLTHDPLINLSFFWIHEGLIRLINYVETVLGSGVFAAIWVHN